MNAIREYVDSITRRAARDAHVDPESEARQELASHLFDLANNRATGRPLTLVDIDAAWAELAPKAIYLLRESPATTSSSEAPTGVAAGPRAAVWIRRLGAYLADVVAVLVAASIIIVPLNFAAVMITDVGAVLFAGLLFGALVLALTAFEVLRGATPGKLLLRLRTVDANGQSPSWLRAWIITLPKFMPPLLAVDILLGLAKNPGARRRLTERLVNLTVIQVT